MQELIAILNILMTILMGVGAFALYLLRSGIEEATKTGVKNAFHDLHWTTELAQELQKTRGVERQELRYKSYGALWKELRPLAIYDDAVIRKETMVGLSSKLSDWYFSEIGGLLLTPQVREFYFVLQNLLRAITKDKEDWVVDRSRLSEGDYTDIFCKILKKNNDTGKAVRVYDYFLDDKYEDWQEKAINLGKDWKDGIKAVAEAWNEFGEQERFATLQQVSSILRTSLTIDVESRLR